jgi:hypothetical protein
MTDFVEIAGNSKKLIRKEKTHKHVADKKGFCKVCGKDMFRR